MRDLLQRLQRALPEVGHWIDELHARHLAASIPASDTGFSRLAAHYPAALLRSTRVAMVDDVPFPPVSAYGLPEFEAMANMPMAGITFRNMYLCATVVLLRGRTLSRIGSRCSVGHPGRARVPANVRSGHCAARICREPTRGDRPRGAEQVRERNCTAIRCRAHCAPCG